MKCMHCKLYETRAELGAISVRQFIGCTQTPHHEQGRVGGSCFLGLELWLLLQRHVICLLHFCFYIRSVQFDEPPKYLGSS